ncbi:hypothetical protein [Burkholderia sp. SRS-W-2-2016]|nr:hypothetical protein [Burkholderia sp. SRS-W-2-2016]
MRKTATEEQRSMALSMLKTAMAISRDDQLFDPAWTLFGRNLQQLPEAQA